MPRVLAGKPAAVMMAVGPRSLPCVAVRFWPKILVDLLYEISAQLVVSLYYDQDLLKNTVLFPPGSKFPFGRLLLAPGDY
jgi:hypothetical protein